MVKKHKESFMENRSSNSGSQRLTGLGKTSVCCYFSPKQLFDPSEFAQELHTEYDINAWCYFGKLQGKKDVYAMTFLIQKNIPALDVIPQYDVVGGINSKSIGTYDLGGCIDLGVNVNKNPWSVQGICLDSLSGPKVSTYTVAAPYNNFSKRGAIYRVNFVDNLNNLDMDMYLEDILGMVHQGYGKNGFLPNWFTKEQRNAIDNQGGFVLKYLEENKDDMSCQGSYYFSQPLLAVRKFSIYKDNKLLDESVCDSSDSGIIWFDYVCQSYNAQGQKLLQNCGWLFFAMQFLEERTAIMVTTVHTDLGDCITANLFNIQGKYTWSINDVDIQPVLESEWTSPKSGQKFYMKYIIKMVNPECVIGIETLWDEQEIIVGNVVKYEGIGNVTAVFPSENKTLHGNVWLELQPVSQINSTKGSKGRTFHTR